MTETDILVLREGTEGLSMESYAETLRERVPGSRVVHANTPAEERAYITDARIVTGITVDESLLDHAENLELFACTFAGTDHVPIDAFRQRGIAVTNAGGIHAPGIAEQALGNMLIFARNLHEGWRRKQNAEWRHFQSYEFTGSTVTIVGLGSIGEALTRRLEGMAVETIGVRYTPEKGGPTDEVVGFDSESVHDALARSDYVVLACPLTETTEHLIDEAALATMKTDAVLVNAARGGIVDTDALVGALRSNKIRGAALDVTEPEPLPSDHPLWGLENCLLTPHTGGHTPKHWSRLADIVADNVDRLDSDEPLRNQVLAPGNER
jgi:phosphoglycerate dehydrogenase-like enzyme